MFAGGFSFGDVLGSARGWAASLLCRPAVRDQLRRFRRRPETFSLGVCNGCQLMALMGWVDPDQPSPSSQSGERSRVRRAGNRCSTGCETISLQK